ncbi:MAG: hypothetical protein ACOC1F_06305, partial [Myxococcota bacterium]
MPDHRQKKRAKQKRKRAKAGRPAVSYVPAGGADMRLAEQLGSMPEGPFFITRGWQVPSQPRLHCIMATRIVDATSLVPAVILVDPGCRGV